MTGSLGRHREAVGRGDPVGCGAVDCFAALAMTRDAGPSSRGRRPWRSIEVRRLGLPRCARNDGDAGPSSRGRRPWRSSEVRSRGLLRCARNDEEPGPSSRGRRPWRSIGVWRLGLPRFARHDGAGAVHVDGWRSVIWVVRPWLRASLVLLWSGPRAGRSVGRYPPHLHWLAAVIAGSNPLRSSDLRAAGWPGRSA